MSSVNSYVFEVAKENPESKITVALFDHNQGFQFDVVRTGSPSGDFELLSSKDGLPRGMTPLYDAIGRIVNLAESENSEKTVIVIITDGHENCSAELDNNASKILLDKCKAKNWQIIFLGADFASIKNQADSVGIGGASAVSLTSGFYGQSMTNLAVSRRDYVSSNNLNIDVQSIVKN